MNPNNLYFPTFVKGYRVLREMLSSIFRTFDNLRPYSDEYGSHVFILPQN